MNVNQAAAHLLRYFPPEERSIPDSGTYPGRNAAVLAAINAAVQECAAEGRPWAATEERGALLHAPTSVTIALTADSREAVVTGWQRWMDGCMIRIEGEPQDGRIWSEGESARLQFPARHSGGFNAMVYATCFPLGSDCMDVRSPVRADGREILPMASDRPTVPPAAQADYGRAVQPLPPPPDGFANPINNAGALRLYRIETFQPAPEAPPLARMVVWPAPAAETMVSYRATLRPPQYTSAASSVTLPVPAGFVESVFLPIAERRLMESPFFLATAIPDGITASYQKALEILASLNPNKTRSPRIIPIG